MSSPVSSWRWGAADLLGGHPGANFGRRSYLLGRLLFLLACGASAFYNTYCKFLVHPKYTELEILYTQAVGSLASIPLFLWVEPLCCVWIAWRSWAWASLRSSSTEPSSPMMFSAPAAKP